MGDEGYSQKKYNFGDDNNDSANEPKSSNCTLDLKQNRENDFLDS